MALYVVLDADGHTLNPDAYEQGGEVLPFITTVPVHSQMEMEARLLRVLSFCIQNNIQSQGTINNLMAMSLMEKTPTGQVSFHFAAPESSKQSQFTKRMKQASKTWEEIEHDELTASM